MKLIDGGRLPVDSRIPRLNSEQTVRTKPFYLSEIEVTRRDWSDVYRRPSKGEDRYPMDRVSWTDCIEFIRTLNHRLPGKMTVFRLPTEAEWEFAARGEPDDSDTGSGSENTKQDFSEHAWYQKNSGQTVHACGCLKPNVFGLYDMLGNVAEWCSGDVASVARGEKAGFRIHRGGSFASTASYANATVRGFYLTGDRRRGLGMRLAADGDVNLNELIRAIDPMVIEGFDRLIFKAKATADKSPRGSEAVKLITDLRLIQAHAQVRSGSDYSVVQSLEEMIESATMSPKQASLARSCLAWILATSSSSELKSPKRAWRLATEARLLHRGHFWPASVALAAASAEVDKFGEAESLVGEAIAQLEPGSTVLPQLSVLKLRLQGRMKLETTEIPTFLSVMVER